MSTGLKRRLFVAAAAAICASAAPAQAIELKVPLPASGGISVRIAEPETAAPSPPAAPLPAAVTPGPEPSSSQPAGLAGASSATPVGGSQRPAPRHSGVVPIVKQIPGGLLAGLLAAVLAALAFGFVWARERRHVRHARQEALVDPLTGIANRLAFERRLWHEWRRATRYHRPLGLLMLDLDDLKQINDADGHAAGDRTLKQLASTISGDIRQSDLAARLAGDEFVVLCPETAADGLRQTAEKLWRKLEERGISVSVGRAELEPFDESPADLVARADVSMYGHKQRKRTVRGGAERRRRRLAAEEEPTAPRDRSIPELSGRPAS